MGKNDLICPIILRPTKYLKEECEQLAEQIRLIFTKNVQELMRDVENIEFEPDVSKKEGEIIKKEMLKDLNSMLEFNHLSHKIVSPVVIEEVLKEPSPTTYFFPSI